MTPAEEDEASIADLLKPKGHKKEDATLPEQEEAVPAPQANVGRR